MSTLTLHPRPHQVTALADLTRALAVHDRTQLLMACGTGKTLVGLWLAQSRSAERILVLLPSLALVAQTLQEWRRATAGRRFSALVVCSDPTTSAGAAERGLDSGDPADVDAGTWGSVSAKVTTNPSVATRFLNQQSTGAVQVVFSTYHSAPVVAAAQAASGAVFDLAICDEAHRLAGRPREEFRVALSSRGIVARKRVFMTATQLGFDGEDSVSMADPAVFGPVAHTVTFGEAIDAGLLTDYQVLVVAAREEQASDTPDPHAIVPAALMDAIDSHQVHRVLSFHSRVAKASQFAETITGALTPGRRRILARHVSGRMPTSRRTGTLRWLAHREPHDSTVRLVSNARCLAEGVDVPAIDGILFADRRTSVVDIIQAIGRVLRPAPGKKRGTIILPVALPPDGDDDSALASSAFAHVWTVLRALRAHDQRLAVEVDRAVRAITHGTHGGHRSPGRIEFILPDDVDRTAVQLRLIQEVGSAWERNYALLEKWAHTHDGRLLPRAAKAGSVNIGEWAEQQRIAYRHGTLPADRADRLGQVPGWAWDKSEARWDLTYDVVRSVADEHGSVADNTTGPSIFAGLKDEDRPQRHLGVWLAVQRQSYRLGTLAERKARLLEALPGWSWDAHLPADDVAMVEALRVFAEFEKHARVPDEHFEDGLPLGAWCWAVRRRKLTDRLAPALEYEILAATPSKFRASQRFQWEKTETQWRLGYFAARQFAAREEHTRATSNHREQLPDTTVNLGQWTSLQRHLRRRGDLEDRRIALLEALPGWQWDISLQTVEASDPVELPDGLEHGAAGAYENYACRCADCLEWRRGRDRERLAARRALKCPVPASRARRHLRRMEDGGAKRTTLATVSGVPLGVVRKVVTGDVAQIEQEHHLRLLAITPSMVEQAQTRVGSRGRLTSQHNERVCSDSTWELLDNLASRGFGITWISRELGYAGSLQLQRGTNISRRIADQVKELHQAVGDLVMPDLPKSVRRPSLAALRTGRAA